MPEDLLEDRHCDIARSVQAMYEEALFHLIAGYNSVLASAISHSRGGCAMNSVANGKIRRMTSFRRVYVQSAAGDAVGAAYVVWHRLGGARSFVMDHAFWGPAFPPGSVISNWQRGDILIGGLHDTLA
jgi:carbamoyltransferase